MVEKMVENVLVNGMVVMVHGLGDCAKFYTVENETVTGKVAAWAAGAVFKDTEMLNFEPMNIRETLPDLSQLRPISPKMAKVLTTLLNGEDEGFGLEGTLTDPVAYVDTDELN